VTDRPQAFWLDQLQSATQYNRWIVSQLLPDLGSSILEVGCGTGTFTELLAQTGSPVTAVDCDAAFVAMAQARLQSYANVQICLGDATQMQWQRSFDTVILLDVLEHIEHDRQLLQQLRQSLQPGGRLILKVPALSWLYSSLDRAIGHHRRYSRATLAEVLQQAGYSNLRLWYFNAAGIPGWWLNGKLLQRTTPPAEQIGWFDRVVPALQAVESQVPLPIGLSLFAVATPVATPSGSEDFLDAAIGNQPQSRDQNIQSAGQPGNSEGQRDSDRVNHD
jgi:SAM-dependent methyltransferase